MSKKKRNRRRRNRRPISTSQVDPEQYPYDLLWRVAFVCIALGILLHVLVYSSGLYFDVEPSDPKLEKWRFGFWSSTYWALGYATAIPFGVGCVVAIHYLLNRIGFSRKQHIIACVLGFVLAGWIVYGDYDRVANQPANDWIQWNHYCEYPVANAPTNAIRIFTFYYSYTLYLAYYTCFIGGVLSIFWFSVKPNKSFFARKEGIERDLIIIGRLFRWSILVLIAYFALVRCCKIEMYFKVFPPKEGTPSISPFEFYKQVESYPDRISSSFYFDLCLLIVWVSICCFLHLRIAQFRLSNEKWKRLRMLEPELFKESLTCLGKPFLLLIGIMTFGVMFPPPDRSSLVQIIGAISVAYLIKLGLEKEVA